MKKNGRGFTLVELLVVIIIIIILASTVVALMNVFFRGQGVRQGAATVTMAFAQCKQLAAEKRLVHFMVFTNAPDGGRINIYRDGNGNKQWDGAAVDPEIPEKTIELPKYVNFTSYPQWCGIEPSGYCLFNTGFSELSAGAFEAANGSPPGAGDIVIQMQNKPFKMTMDVERSSGKIRKAHFFAQ
jgi:prepilin-type N-terminal cleavage/methylation domain-containing protein